MSICRQDQTEAAEEARAETVASHALKPFRASSPYVSQEHALLGQTPEGRYWVKDLNSANGTWMRLPPYQVVELPSDFELLVAKDLILQHRTSPWVTFPDVRRFVTAEDLVAHLRSALKSLISELRIVPAYGPEHTRASGLCTRLPLIDQRQERQVLLVRWRATTFDLKVERWLQTCVLLFNSGATGELPPRDGVPWDFIAASSARRMLLEIARRVAPSPGTVLLYGASGTGKEVLARDLHRHSLCAKGPFVAVNCAALPADLIEGELFGTTRGAFTGATDRPGLFLSAHEGTIFLDEIGELPLALQAKLLRVLEQKRVRRLGDSEERPVNVRVIAATNRNLEQMVEEQKFRADLWFRLNGVQLTLPDLGTEDVMALAPAMCQQLAREGYRQLSEEESVCVAALAAQAQWPGNARELRSALQRYLTFYSPDCSVQQNWDFARQCSGSLLRKGLTAVSVEAPPVQEELPEQLRSLSDSFDSLVFLWTARQVLFPYRWGALTELGHKLGMTGAGVSQKLRRLNVKTDPEPDSSQLDAQIELLRGQLRPHAALVRRILAV